MFYEIRRKDRVLNNERAQELLQTAEYGFLSTGAGENGYAYGVPMSYYYDIDRNSLYFHCAPEGHKLNNLKLNNKVSFCVVGRTKPEPAKFTSLFESVIIFGTVESGLADDEKKEGLRGLIRKYSAGFEDKGEIYIEKSFHRTFVFKINIEHITAKAK